jgi:hypothetical protein
MKRVRYAFGVVALAPAVVAATPAAAHAAATNHVPRGKTVHLDHPAATTGLTSCVASRVFSASSTGSLVTKMTGFYDNFVHGDICVGTIYVTRHFINKNCVTFHMKVRYASGTTTPTSSRVCASFAGQNRQLTHTFREEFPGYNWAGGKWVEVSVSSNYGFTGVLISSQGDLIGAQQI